MAKVRLWYQQDSPSGLWMSAAPPREWADLGIYLQGSQVARAPEEPAVGLVGKGGQNLATSNASEERNYCSLNTNKMIDPLIRGSIQKNQSIP